MYVNVTGCRGRKRKTCLQQKGKKQDETAARASLCGAQSAAMTSKIMSFSKMSHNSSQ